MAAATMVTAATAAATTATAAATATAAVAIHLFLIFHLASTSGSSHLVVCPPLPVFF
jgi:hypothetical protein